MPARRLCSDQEAVMMGFSGQVCQRRRDVLRETISAFENAPHPDHFHRLAVSNLANWASSRGAQTMPSRQVLVLPGDWGDVTLSLSKRFGACFAVLNMANPEVPGGAYGEGAAAQEENMFRRTDCHFSIRPEHLDETGFQYSVAMHEQITGVHGRVHLDVNTPRVCIRGAERPQAPDLGYEWLEADEVFPFFELRSAAQDLRDGSRFDPLETRRRIAAQLDTLREASVRHVVLGAFGCGAFRNPAGEVARLYREEILARQHDFRVIAFAIYAAGYGPDNFTPFEQVMRELTG